MFRSVLLLALAAAAAARKCTNITVPVSLTSENAVFDLEKPLTNVDVTDFFLRMTRAGTHWAQEIQTGTVNVSGNYQLSTSYCEPDSGPGSELQILTHGVGFDRSYWDLSYNDYNYSYVARAVDEHGYSTFTWDRLGIGQSSKGDALSEIQSFLEIAALHELTTRLSEGTLKGVDAKFDKIVHVGHSFGSIMTYALSNMWPESTDAIVLTGFSQDMTYMAQFALGGNFVPTSTICALAGKYPEGYVAPSSTVGVHINFFAPGDFDPQLLEVAFKDGQPAAVGELLTLGAPASGRNAFAGPVLIITGEHDVPFCGGNCLVADTTGKDVSSLLATSEENFPSASQFNTTIVLGAGHGLNMGYSHTFTYDSILDFLSRSL